MAKTKTKVQTRTLVILALCGLGVAAIIAGVVGASKAKKAVSCEDTDGGFKLEQKGEVTVTYDDGSKRVSPDRCYNSKGNKGIQENFCNKKSNKREWRSTNCGDGKICQNGACVIASTCTDTDEGKDVYTKGTITLDPPVGGISTKTDTCWLAPNEVEECESENQCYVHEYSCLNPASYVDSTLCPYGCRDGACLQKACNRDADCSSQDCSSGQAALCKSGQCQCTPITCTDSDEGKKPAVQGTLTLNPPLGGISSKQDYCWDLSAPDNKAGRTASCQGGSCYLHEFYCGLPESVVESMPCPNGCANGVCQ